MGSSQTRNQTGLRNPPPPRPSMSAAGPLGQHGFTELLLPILLLLIVVLFYFFGWIVLVGVAAIFVIVPAGTAIYDRVTHDTRCRWCNVIKDELAEELGISIEEISTKHERVYDDHIIVGVSLPDRRDLTVTIDFNGEILDGLPLGGNERDADSLRSRL